MIDKLEDWVVGGAAAVVGLVAGLYGGWTQGTKVLVLLMIVDYVLGCICALTGHSPKTVTGHFLSQVAFMGLLKKGVIMLVILLAVQLDKALGHTEAGGAVLFRSAAEFFYIATEGLSIVENAGLLGVPVPKGIKQALEALRDKNDKDKD
jgi:toxin secretion/phage lysis holin